MHDSKEFLEILEQMPKWFYLTPGLDKWRNGDQAWTISNSMDSLKWRDMPSQNFNKIIEDESILQLIGRRPIPESIRRSQAFWVLYAQYMFTGDIDDSFDIDDMNEIYDKGPGQFEKWIMEMRK